jgi:hypothetical protein
VKDAMTDYPFWPYPLDPAKPRNKLESGFWGVHALYPAIYERVDLLCVRLISEGRKRYAVDAFFNQLRWHASASMDPPEPWKMNDHYRPYYARFWLQNNEAHWGFFELRRVKGEYPFDEWAVDLE